MESHNESASRFKGVQRTTSSHKSRYPPQSSNNSIISTGSRNRSGSGGSSDLYTNEVQTSTLLQDRIELARQSKRSSSEDERLIQSSPLRKPSLTRLHSLQDQLRPSTSLSGHIKGGAGVRQSQEVCLTRHGTSKYDSLTISRK